MDKDLNMTSSQLSYCVAFFYIGFLLFELPSAILLRVLTPPVQLGIALTAWGGATAMYVVNPDSLYLNVFLEVKTDKDWAHSITEAQNWQTIAGLRVVVGAFEAFIQGAPLYLTFWYKPQELATRGAIFLSMVSIAGSANGLISYAIEKTMDGRYGRPAWRWIFLVEGK
jgi:MFS family permease